MADNHQDEPPRSKGVGTMPATSTGRVHTGGIEGGA